MILNWEKNKKILFFIIFIGMILLPGCDDSPTRPGEEFYSYQGYGCLIYASGSVRNFATIKKLEHFIKLNYPDSALPEMMKLENFYKLMWQAINKIKRTAPQKLSY